MRKSYIEDMYCEFLFFMNTHVCMYALYVYLHSYEFVIWPDCFVGHLCPGGICPKSGPLSPTCSITTMLFSLVYFSVDVCLVGVFPHSVSTRRDSCVRVCAPLTLASPLTRKQKSKRGDPALHLGQVSGHLN